MDPNEIARISAEMAQNMARAEAEIAARQGINWVTIGLGVLLVLLCGAVGVYAGSALTKGLREIVRSAIERVDIDHSNAVKQLGTMCDNIMAMCRSVKKQKWVNDIPQPKRKEILKDCRAEAEAMREEVAKLVTELETHLNECEAQNDA